MTRDKLYEFFDKTIVRCREKLVERNEKRAMKEDALSNLRGEAMVCGKDVRSHVLDYIGLKLHRIQYANHDGTDTTDDTDDMINYLILFGALKHKGE